MLHSETYLFGAKWQNALTPASDLHVFEGKLREKADCVLLGCAQTEDADLIKLENVAIDCRLTSSC